MCDQVAAWSNCPRAQVGAFIVKDNQPISQGFNGPPKGAAKLCGGAECRRDTLAIKSGTSTEIGCHHAEANAITQAAKNGAGKPWDLNRISAHLSDAHRTPSYCVKTHVGMDK